MEELFVILRYLTQRFRTIPLKIGPSVSELELFIITSQVLRNSTPQMFNITLIDMFDILQAISVQGPKLERFRCFMHMGSFYHEPFI